MALLFALTAHPASAQAGTPAEVQHRNDCRLAQQVLVHGQPANKRQWALGYFVRCSDTAAETAVRLLRRYAPTAAPDADFERFVSSVSTLVDRNLALAAIDLAENAGAPAYARVQAMRILRGQVRPEESISFETVTRPPTRIVAQDSMRVVYEFTHPETLVTGHPGYRGTPLTRSDLSAITGRLQAVAGGTSTSAHVRQAAMNVADTIEASIRFGDTCAPGTTISECTERMRARSNDP